tara:strand:+ start:43 stop:507 length:465 start_codon:yes stop_codon:yes gene_type:complete
MLYNIKDLKEKRISLQKSDNIVVFTNGCFDILHKGHFQYLKQSKDLGDFLIVGLNSDKSVKFLKGPGRPVNGEKIRAENLLKLDYVNAVIIFNENTPIKLIENLLPDIVTKGGDYEIDEIVGSKIIHRNGGEVKILPYLEGFSTTKIISDKGNA